MTELVGVAPRPGDLVQIGCVALVDIEPGWVLVDEVFTDASDDRWTLLFGRWLIGCCGESRDSKPVRVFVPGLVVRRCSAAV
jgi:hypothetical protein